MNDPQGLPRRDFLKGALAASAAGLAANELSAEETPTPGPKQPTARKPADPIAQENARQGAPDWQLTRVRLDESSIRCPAIEGYCSQQSVAPGDSLSVQVSMEPAGKFQCEIFRLGYYGGQGARLFQTIGPLKASPQPTPPVGPRRLRECQWEPTFDLKIGQDWPSGVYVGRLTRHSSQPLDPAWQSYIIFIVRNDQGADILLQCSDNTWQAYNRWPDTYSLYDGDDQEWALETGVDVSFDRPYGKYRQIYENPQSLGSGEFLCWEYPLAYFLEQHGYSVSYCSNRDMVTPELGLKHKAFISVGHDEYWDVRQYHSVKKMIDQGVNALFLCGNSVAFVSPFRDSRSGQPQRIITRSGCFGEMTDKEKDRMPGLEATGPDESLLIGARSVIPFNGGGDWIVTQPDHWLFAGTGMQQGDFIPGLVGWEFHGDPAPIPGLEVIAQGTAVTGRGQPSDWAATIYPGPRGNFVFNASTIYWSQGLASPPGHMLPWSHGTRPHGPDSRVQQITHNALRRAIR
ncbi:N,N-dimethylformamidase beta subunit family domain-containing protein [Lignipirellula cremea]|uniref:N,N-dimethylformamidase beta subunit-like C-terminal domain-containing protein n=1 Tax=Lignipirellula cremea TaxID=2528010 RepID=A0A518DZB9_9BACT|nr:N,N-dimethylformamidase beta subunit family domain-containing protein [Lignipirellula cremea]QDU97179.1 hypothetical protein Pla8534_50240 [Lignipirellula cremea]